jgi:hypothetical protein
VVQVGEVLIVILFVDSVADEFVGSSAARCLAPQAAISGGIGRDG